MRVRVEYEEHTTHAAFLYITPDDLEALRATVEDRTYNEFWDEVENQSSETDGGVDWDSIKIEVVE